MGYLSTTADYSVVIAETYQCAISFYSIKGGGKMNYELRAGKKLAVFWEENGEVFDNRKARSFKPLKDQKIVPVVIESGSERAEDCLYVLFKQNRGK